MHILAVAIPDKDLQLYRIRRMHSLQGYITYGRVTHMQLTWYCLYRHTVFSPSKFLTQYAYVRSAIAVNLSQPWPLSVGYQHIAA